MRLYDVVNFFRSRGENLVTGYRLWKLFQIRGMAFTPRRVTPGDLKWARERR